MSSQFRDKPTSESKRHGQQSHHSEPPMPNYLVEAIPSPFSDAARSLSSEKPLTYIPQSERNGETSASPAPAGSSASLQRSLTSTAASKVKKALGLESSGRRRNGGESSGQERVKRAVTTGDEKDEDAGKVKKKVQQMEDG
ncbi:hypothetical protein SLEP1_g10988 [Rubroshorea leprosula]|uniref:Uncharacterized protein n=1 Tax=Rubroshorea leprosula TaxID=152421 RepID=A0AAV5IL86_9ROSI|nr:hypothetical protein SLEP1_g10988 [Rubroshorea leprosula]